MSKENITSISTEVFQVPNKENIMEQYQSQDITKLVKALLSVQRVLQAAVKDALNPFAKESTCVFE